MTPPDESILLLLWAIVATLVGAGVAMLAGVFL